MQESAERAELRPEAARLADQQQENLLRHLLRHGLRPAHPKRETVDRSLVLPVQHREGGFIAGQRPSG